MPSIGAICLLCLFAAPATQPASAPATQPDEEMVFVTDYSRRPHRAGCHVIAGIETRQVSLASLPAITDPCPFCMVEMLRAEQRRDPPDPLKSKDPTVRRLAVILDGQLQAALSLLPAVERAGIGNDGDDYVVLGEEGHLIYGKIDPKNRITFKNSKIRAEAFRVQKAKIQRLRLDLRRLSEGSFNIALWLPSRLQVGAVGRFRGALRIQQIVTDSEVIAVQNDEWVWIEGVDTKPFVDGRFAGTDVLFEIVGTKRYKTAAGSSRTIFHAKPLR